MSTVKTVVKYAIVVVAILFISTIISAFVFGVDSSDSKKTNFEKTSNNEEISTYNKESTATIDEQIPEKIYEINENIKLDYLTYKVTKVESFNKMGLTAYNKETNGKFIKVYIDITNDAKETENIFSPRFKIEDNQERMYDRLSDDSMYIADYIEFGKQLQPGLMASGAIVFEMPKDSFKLKLVISGDWSSLSEVKVDLHNIHDIDVDTTLQDEQDKMMDEIMQESYARTEEMMAEYY
jgi:hypothetical protein